MKALVINNGHNECVLDVGMVSLCNSPGQQDDGKWVISLLLETTEVTLTFANEDLAKSAYIDIKRDMIMEPVPYQWTYTGTSTTPSLCSPPLLV